MINFLQNLFKENIEKDSNILYCIDPLQIENKRYIVLNKKSLLSKESFINAMKNEKSKILLNFSQELQYITIDLIINDIIYYTVELNFNNENDIIKNWKNFYKLNLDFNKLKQCVFYCKNGIVINKNDIINYKKTLKKIDNF